MVGMINMVHKRIWKGFKFEIQHGENLNMIDPDFYEGIEGYGNKPITKEAMKTVIADWVDLPNREIPLVPIEKRMLKNFTKKEKEDIFGTSAPEKYSKKYLEKSEVKGFKKLLKKYR
jgi:hypothetical protein